MKGRIRVAPRTLFTAGQQAASRRHGSISPLDMRDIRQMRAVLSTPDIALNTVWWQGYLTALLTNR